MATAIWTRYVPPTDTRGARISVGPRHADLKPGERRRLYPWDHTMGSVENHHAAAARWAREAGYTGRLVVGTTNGAYVYLVDRAASRVSIERGVRV